MKVVLFCGGLGLRLRDYSDEIPKPMVPIGDQPIIWHLMKYYAHFGHRDFVLCLGYKADSIKKYFLAHNECLTNDSKISEGGAQVHCGGRDLQDWRISFVDTGVSTSIGGRLRAVREYVREEGVFLANYTDNLSDADLSVQVQSFLRTDAVAAFLSVPPNVSYHLVETDNSHRVVKLQNAAEANLWSNGGFFVFRQEIFDYLGTGEDLVEKPFHRLIQLGKLVAFPHNGFWACMDTFKERQQLDDLCRAGRPPWQVWDRGDRLPVAPADEGQKDMTKGIGA